MSYIDEPVEDYRKILRTEFAKRKAHAARYSLRQFAKLLGLTPSHLCEVMKGKKGLSNGTAEKIGFALGFKTKDRKYFRFLVNATDSRALCKRNLGKMGLQRLKTCGY